VRPGDELYLSKPRFETESKGRAFNVCNQLIGMDVDFCYSVRNGGTNWIYSVEVSHRYKEELLRAEELAP